MTLETFVLAVMLFSVALTVFAVFQRLEKFKRNEYVNLKGKTITAGQWFLLAAFELAFYGLVYTVIKGNGQAIVAVLLIGMVAMKLMLISMHKSPSAKPMAASHSA